jgi:FdhD protein
MTSEGSIPLPIQRWKKGEGLQPFNDSVALERTLELLVAGTVIARLQCLPLDLEDLAAGFLITGGIVEGADDITGLTVAPDGTRVDVEVRGRTPEDLAEFGRKLSLASGCGKALFPTEVRSRLSRSPGEGFSPEAILHAVRETTTRGELFKKTGAVHAASAWRGEGCIAFREDIARHNAIDKVAGAAVRQGATLEDCLLVSTGRLTAEVVMKGIRLGVWGVASRAAATDRAVQLAAEFGLVLAGFARGSRINIYCGAGRLRGEGPSR